MGIEMSGFDELCEMFGEMGQEIDSVLEKAVELGGAVIQGHIKLLCPVGDSGDLRRSITVNTERDEDGGYKAVIGTNLEYAPYVEFGTGIHSTKAGRQDAWCYYDPESEYANKDGFVWTKGSKPQPFMYPGFEQGKNEANAVAIAKIKEVLSG